MVNPKKDEKENHFEKEYTIKIHPRSKSKPIKTHSRSKPDQCFFIFSLLITLFYTYFAFILFYFLFVFFFTFTVTPNPYFRSVSGSQI